MISPKVFAIFAALPFSSYAHAAMTFAEDFSGDGRGPNLVVTGGSESTIEYSGGTAKFTGLEPTGSSRAYLGTAFTFDLAAAFNAEIDVVVPTGSAGNGLAFFGFGTGQRGDSSQTDPNGGPSYYEPSSGPSAYFALIPSDFGNTNNDKIASGDFNGVLPLMGGTSSVIPASALVGSGAHKLQLIYSPSTSSVQFAYKKQGATRSGDPWVVATIIDVSNNNFTNQNGRIFFGGSGNVSFDNLSGEGVLIPEPSALSIFVIFSCSSLLRRRR